MLGQWIMRLRFGCVALLCLALGCSHLEQVPIEEELGAPGQERPWVLIDGFTRRDGAEVEVRGYAGVVRDSFLVYEDEPRRGAGPRLLAALPRSEVTRVHFKVQDKEKTAELVGSLAAIVVLVAILIVFRDFDKSLFYK